MPCIDGGGNPPGGGMRKSGGSPPGGGNGMPFGSVGIGGPGAPEELGGNGGNGIPRPSGATAEMLGWITSQEIGIFMETGMTHEG